MEADRKTANDALNRLPGGPVFPVNIPLTPPSVCNPGISLRDYFAAKAMEGILSNPEIVWQSTDKIAADAYGIADSMLEQRG